jgi:hypothetical protein
VATGNALRAQPLGFPVATEKGAHARARTAEHGADPCGGPAKEAELHGDASASGHDGGMTRRGPDVCGCDAVRCSNALDRFSDESVIDLTVTNDERRTAQALP